jgi:Ca2+-binding RTX toxin-like protein
MQPRGGKELLRGNAMTQQDQAASWRRAFLLLLAGICAAWLQGCATKPQAQYKVYFCNMESAMVSEVRINYGGALWAIPPLPASVKDGDEKCLGGYAAAYAGSVITLTRQSGLAAGQVEVVKLLGSTLADNVYFSDGFIKTSTMINALKSGTAVVLDTSQRTDTLLAIPAVLSEGADTMAGGTGNDTFMVDDAADVVTELAGEGTDTVQSYLANYTLGLHVENLTLLGNLNAGGTGNALANVLSGNAGNNTLVGGAGGDSYLAYRGMGQDRIIENDSTSGIADVLSFGTGIANDQLWFRQAGNDLEVSVIGTADKATVQNWYLGDSYRVEQIKSGDGKVLQHIDVDKLVSAMAGFAPPAMGETILTASQQAALAPVLAANWH